MMKTQPSHSRALFGSAGKTLKGLGIIGLGALALTASAAEPATHVDFREVQRSVPVIGQVIKDSRNQKLGRIYDLALDVENGRIVEVIVSSGGFLGFGQRTVAVPPGAFVVDPAGGVLRLNVTLPDLGGK